MQKPTGKGSPTGETKMLLSTTDQRTTRETFAACLRDVLTDHVGGEKQDGFEAIASAICDMIGESAIDLVDQLKDEITREITADEVAGGWR